MIKIKREPEKRYRVAEVSKAVGLSEHAVSGYFNNRHVSTKGGVTIEQIYEMCKGGRRGDIDWDTVRKIREILAQRYGVEIIESNTDDSENERK